MESKHETIIVTEDCIYTYTRYLLRVPCKFMSFGL